MKINKLNIKKGIKVLALSISLVTSGISMVGCSKKTVNITVDDDTSILDLNNKYVCELINKGIAFVEFESINEDGSCVRLPSGYSLYTVYPEECDFGMVGISNIDGYNVYNLGYSIDDSGNKIANSTNGCVGMHDALIQTLKLYYAILADVQSENSIYATNASNLSFSDERGNYIIEVPNDLTLINKHGNTLNIFDSLEICETESNTIYKIDAKCNYSINDLKVVSKDVARYLSLGKNVYSLSENIYSDIYETGKIDGKYQITEIVK